MNRPGLRARWVSIVWLLPALAGVPPPRAAETADQLIAGAKTLGGRKGFSEIEAAFNKKFGLKARIHFMAGPQMSSMAARLITEAKAGRKSSTGGG